MRAKILELAKTYLRNRRSFRNGTNFVLRVLNSVRADVSELRDFENRISYAWGSPPITVREGNIIEFHNFISGRRRLNGPFIISKVVSSTNPIKIKVIGVLNSRVNEIQVDLGGSFTNSGFYISEAYEIF